jgi:hypothetical protein
MNWLDAGVAVYGAITGTIALVLVILGYRRDAGRLTVKLSPAPDASMIDPIEKRVCIEVVNAGRRNVHFRIARLVFEDGSTEDVPESKLKLLTETEPLRVCVDLAIVRKREAERKTRLLCAVAVDSLGQHYYSDVPKNWRGRLKQLKPSIESEPVNVLAVIRDHRKIVAKYREEEADLWLLPVRSEPPPDATELPRMLSFSHGPPKAPILQYLFIVNRGNKTAEGGGRVELWVPISLLDNALEHVGDWKDQHFSEEIEGVKCRLFHRDYSAPIYPGKSIDLPPFRFGRVALGSYTLYFQVITSARTYPGRDSRMRLPIEFTTYKAIRGEPESEADNLPSVPRSTADIQALSRRVAEEFSKVDPNWRTPLGQPISVGYALYGIPGSDKVDYVVSNGRDKQSEFEAAMLRALGEHAGSRIR